jgi:hypothetical protein
VCGCTHHEDVEEHRSIADDVEIHGQEHGKVVAHVAQGGVHGPEAALELQALEDHHHEAQHHQHLRGPEADVELVEVREGVKDLRNQPTDTDCSLNHH